VTPYVLSSVATPPVICFTTAFFHSTACAKIPEARRFAPLVLAHYLP
jgi:hypothetical protein